jgi:HD-like signal output (HDOD) protein
MSRLSTESIVVAITSPTAPIVESKIRRCGQIGTLPSVAAQIVRLSAEPDSALEDLNRIIMNDPVLSARILKVVNSAYYGVPGTVNSINRAIALLGFKAVKNIALAGSLVKLFRGGVATKTFSAKALWTHSVAVATGARLLARQTACGCGEEAFLAGLLHDIGILVEMLDDGPAFVRMLNRLATDEGLAFRKLEEETFGASHEAFGAGLCKHWNFPPSLQDAAGFHHHPEELPEDRRQLPILVHVADVLSARLKLGYTRTVETQSIDPQFLSRLNLSADALERLAEQLTEPIKQAQSLFEAS